MDKQQVQTMKAFGFSVEEIPAKKVPTMTFWNTAGIPLPNLPADPYHMSRYLKRGFTLKPPTVNPLLTDPAPGGDEIIQKTPTRRKKPVRKYKRRVRSYTIKEATP